MLSLEGEVYKPQSALGNTVDHTVCAKPVKWIFCLQPLSGDPGGYRSGFCIYRDLYARGHPSEAAGVPITLSDGEHHQHSGDADIGSLKFPASREVHG